MTHARPRGPAAAALPWAALAAAWAAIYLVGLGDAPFTRTEGHRAVPAFTILETGEWFPTRLFEVVYLNKPPGMPWAIACSALVLGETAFAARLISALSIAVLAALAAIFARRWFGGGVERGPRVALWAAAAAVATPRFWSIGRTADIEPMLLASTALAVFPLIDLLLRPPRAIAHRCALAGMVSMGVVLAVLAKGPACLPVLAAAPIAAALADRSRRPAGLWTALAALGLGGLAVAALALLAARAVPADEPSVMQTGGEFLWTADALPGILMLAPAAFALALPTSLAMLLPWGRDAHAEIGGGRRSALTPDGWAAARTLAITAALAVVAMALVGLSNPRYALPAYVLLPPLWGYAALGWSGAFDAVRRRIMGVMLLGHPAAWPVLLASIASLVWRPLDTADRRARSAEPAGAALAAALPPGSTVLVGEHAYIRPELPWRLAREAPGGARIVWKHRGVAEPGPPATIAPGVVLLVKPREADAPGALGVTTTPLARSPVGRGAPEALLLRVDAAPAGPPGASPRP